MAERPAQQNRYTVTYAFDGHLRRGSTAPISRIRKTIETLQDEGATIEFLGAMQAIDGNGHPSEITVWYKTPTKRYIAWLNWKAELPACGPPQFDERHPPQSVTRDVAVADVTPVET